MQDIQDTVLKRRRPTRKNKQKRRGVKKRSKLGIIAIDK
jgi:hypothetical protein